MHRIRVHDPSHGLFVRIHVRRRHIFFRPDEVEQLRGIAASHSFELTHRHLLRITNDSSLCSTKRNIDHSTFPGHPRCQRSNLVDIHIWRVANSSLCRATREVVLHAIAFEDLNPARIHSRGNIDFEFPVGYAHHGVQDPDRD